MLIGIEITSSVLNSIIGWVDDVGLVTLELGTANHRHQVVVFIQSD